MATICRAGPGQCQEPRILPGSSIRVTKTQVSELFVLLLLLNCDFEFLNFKVQFHRYWDPPQKTSSPNIFSPRCYNSIVLHIGSSFSAFSGELAGCETGSGASGTFINLLLSGYNTRC